MFLCEVLTGVTRGFYVMAALLAAVYMNPVPLVPTAVPSLINHRLASLLATERATSRPSPREPGPDTDDDCANLLVHEVGEVLEVDEGTFEPPRETLHARPRELTRGAYKLDNRLHVLDVERTLNFALNSIEAR